MVTESIATTYAGARVPRLVNREDILERIADAVRDPSGQTYVFYIEAPGGTGKTFLAREVLRGCRKWEWAAPNLLAARNEVDLYHHQTHSREGFMAALVEALAAGPGYFVAYEEQRQHLQEVKYDLRGAVSELREHRRLLSERFLDDFEELGGQKRVVVVLDTVEKLVYETDRVQQALGLSEEEFSVRPWLLKEWLPQMHNAVILICGRPSERFAADLRTALKEHPDVQFGEPELGNFTEKDTLDYFDAVRETAEKDSNERALRRLGTILPETRQVVHYLTEGHPITLALMIDYYLVTGRLLPEVKVSLAASRGKTPEELKRIRDKVKADVVRQFQEIGRPADETILALAWAPKGVDAELLARISGMSEEEACEILKVLADPTAGLSFIKIRPADKHAFLQDEMYALMKEHVLDKLPEARADEVYGEILAYYEEKIRAGREKVQRLGRLERGKITPDGRVITVAAPSGPADPRALVIAKAELDDLLVEHVYYQLQDNPTTGFETYCEYAEEAVTSNDDNLDMQLRDEILAFVRKAFGDGQAEVRGLQRGDVERYAASLWVWRNVYASKPREAYKIARYLRKKEAEFMDEGGPLTWADLNVSEGWAAAFLGSDLEKTESQLRETIQILLKLLPESEFERRRRDVLLAKAYNVLGYLVRVRGRFQAACDAYRRALPLWRDLEREADHAETLNNLSWATAEAGDFDRALRYCKDGLDLREKLEHRYLLALSYNTLGLISIKNDQPGPGQAHCGRALAIFRDMKSPRGIGLTCTALAEAHRRHADATDVYFPSEKVKQLRLAEEFALQAVQIFRDEVPEQLRLVEALNELGCVYRNWAKLWPEYHEEQDPDQAELRENGIVALKKAARLAADELPYRQVDALVNLAWLHFYVKEPEQAVDVLSEADKIMPQEYYITTEGGVPKVEDAIIFLWAQMGKAQLLRGQIALQEYLDKPSVKGKVRDEALVREIAKHFMLTLAYTELFAEDFRDMRRAKDTMYDALRGINLKELQALYEGVDSTAQAYHLECRPRTDSQPARPRMRNFLEEYFGTPEEYGGIAP
jgi:tetratricopeptide (TPR) repeat protein